MLFGCHCSRLRVVIVLTKPKRMGGRKCPCLIDFQFATKHTMDGSIEKKYVGNLTNVLTNVWFKINNI